MEWLPSTKTKDWHDQLTTSKQRPGCTAGATVEASGATLTISTLKSIQHPPKKKEATLAQKKKYKKNGDFRQIESDLFCKSLYCVGLSGRIQFKKIMFEMEFKVKHLFESNIIVYSWHYTRMIKRHSFCCKNIGKMLEKARCHTTTLFIRIVLVKPKCAFLFSICSLHALFDIFPFIVRNTAVFLLLYSTVLYTLLYCNCTVSVLCLYCNCTATVLQL